MNIIGTYAYFNLKFCIYIDGLTVARTFLALFSERESEATAT